MNHFSEIREENNKYWLYIKYILNQILKFSRENLKCNKCECKSIYFYRYLFL